MNIDFLVKVVTLILTISVANERLVEIVKGWSDWLSDQKTDPKEERKRQNVLQMMSVVGGWITSSLASQSIASTFQQNSIPETVLAVILIGICASGGSSFWNSILTYLLKVKDMKSTAADNQKSQAVVEQGLHLAAAAQLRAPLQAVADNEALAPDVRAKARQYVQGLP